MKGHIASSAGLLAFPPRHWRKRGHRHGGLTQALAGSGSVQPVRPRRRGRLPCKGPPRSPDRRHGRTHKYPQQAAPSRHRGMPRKGLPSTATLRLHLPPSPSHKLRRGRSRGMGGGSCAGSLKHCINMVFYCCCCHYKLLLYLST